MILSDMKTTRNQTASNRRPNVVKPPGIVGENCPFQGNPSDRRAQHVTLFKSKITKKKKKKTKKKKGDNQVYCDSKNFRTARNNIKIAQINVEGLTRAKADILSKIFSEVDVLTIQETHVPEGEASRLKIIGFDLVNYILHKKHGLATYINQKKSFGNIEQVARNNNATGVRIDNLTIFNEYKPPS